MLDAPRLGCFNVHASRLPRWRGAAPIQRAIMAGDTETAVMVMKMEEGLDTGPVGATAVVPIWPETSRPASCMMFSRAKALGSSCNALARLEAGRAQLHAAAARRRDLRRQDRQERSCASISRARREVHNLIRGLSPFPGAWFEATPEGGTPERIKVLRSSLAEGSGTPGTALDDTLTIACGEGAVRLVEVQRAGKKAMSAAEFLRGFPVPKGRALADRLADACSHVKHPVRSRTVNGSRRHSICSMKARVLSPSVQEQVTMRILTAIGAAAAVAGGAATMASAEDAYTTRIEPRATYGATITVEEGVRVFRPLPSERHVIVNPGVTVAAEPRLLRRQAADPWSRQRLWRRTSWRRSADNLSDLAATSRRHTRGLRDARVMI